MATNPVDRSSDVEISVLIVSWRTPDDAIECVRLTQRALSDRVADIVVVDNDSRDGTAESLEAEFGQASNVRVVANRTNRGYAGGNNQAFALSSGRLVAIVNPDVRPSAEAFDRLIGLARDPTVGLASCCLVGLDGRPQTLHRRLPSMWVIFFVWTRAGAWIDHRLLGRRARNAYKYLARPRIGVAEVEQVGGAFVMLRRSAVERYLGGRLLDERLPILMNDVDLSKRARDAGLRNVVDWDTAVPHRGGASLRQLDPARRRELLWDGLSRYYESHGSATSRLALNCLQRLAISIEDDGNPDVAGRPAASGLDAVNKDDLITIVIPCYNYGRFVADAIRSALDQTYDNLEIIVINDGSTDDSATVIDRFSDRVRVVHQPNRGLSAVRNKGAILATGPYVAYLDADDTLRPDFSRRCLESLRQRPAAGFAYPQLALHRPTGVVPTALPPYDLDRLLNGNEIAACALIRTELVRRHPFDEKNQVGWEDWDFWLELAEHGWGGVLVDEVLMDYRRHGENMTERIRGVEKRELQYQVLRRHVRLAGLRRLAKLRLMTFRLRAAIKYREVREGWSRRFSYNSRWVASQGPAGRGA